MVKVKRTRTLPQPTPRPHVIEPPQRTQVAVDPRTDGVVDAVRRWHDDERHEGVMEFCFERPCRDVVEAVR